MDEDTRNQTSTTRPGSPTAVSPVWLAVALVLAAAVVGVVLLRLRPPAPLPIDAPPGAFSAARAAVVLRELAGDGAPHPVGSAAHAAVRSRLVARLEALGLPVAVRSSFVCSGHAPVCGTVENVIARLPGAPGGPAVVLVAHYDSVAAGAGIADDLASVAALVEVARALTSGAAGRNPVVLLFDDGEEPGLLGAEAFVADEESAREVGAVVNLEARGTGGESIMFETSDENAWLVDAYARSVRRPAALSVTYEAYKRLPNDTDLTVFKRAGMAGMNFAFIDEVSHYHTPLDDLAHLDLGSLQHQGENALAMARALAGADLAHPRPGRSCYQDLLGFALLRWPAGLTVFLAAGPFVIVLLATWAAVRRRTTTAGAVLWGLGGFAGIAAAVAAAGLALTRAVEILARAADPWLAHPLPTQLSLWAGALAAGGAAASLAARRAGFRGLLAGTWLAWSGLAVGVAVVAPGAATMFVIPALAAAVALGLAESLPAGATDGPFAAAAAALVPVAAVAWMPLGF
ncbi:MAG: M28 family peptidase, partial [Thermoanaerobaculaceae bacterium]|nr:M28 family peptidase [Thermoanaerobaculaceae bacterium]